MNARSAFMRATARLVAVALLASGCSKSLPTLEDLPPSSPNGADANAGEWRYLVVSGPGQFSVAPPTSTASDAYQTELAAIRTAQANITEKQQQAIEYWSGETHELMPGITLIRTGGHFTGSTVLHWAEGAEGRGALMTADSITVVPDTRWVSFMYSYPNLIPMNARGVERIVKAVKPFAFDRIYGGWWDRVVETDAKAAVQRSAERYIAAIR